MTACFRTVVALMSGMWLALGEGTVATSSTSRVADVVMRLGDYRVAHWSTAQGLPQNSVNDIVRLPNGELWVATFGGLARFDGEHFQVMDMASDERLPTHRIVSLAVAGPDAFWFLTQQGHLGRVQRGAATALVPAASPSVDALDLLVDRTGHLFFKSAEGGFWHTDGARPWQRVEGRPGQFQSMEESEDGTVWAVWGDRLVRITGGPRDAPARVPDHGVAAFRRAGGGLWLGLGRTIARFLDDRLTRLDVRPPIEQRVTALESADGGALWVASGSDVSRLDPQPDGTWRRRSLPLGLSKGMTVRRLNVDTEGSLWIGTDGQGLYRANRLPTRRVGIGSTLVQVSGLAPDGHGGAFVVSGCRGLFHVDSSEFVRAVRVQDHTDQEQVVGDGCGLALAPSRAGGVWVRAGPHLFHVTHGGLEVRRLRIDVPHDEGPIAATPDGSLWVVSRQGTVQFLSPEGRILRELSLPSPLMSASVAPDNALWVGGDGQVFKVGREAAELEQYGREEGVPRGLLRDVFVEPDGTAWVGTYGGGIGRLRGGRVARLSVVHGLPDNSVSRMLDDGRGRMWILTNRGVAVFEMAELHAVADGRVRTLAPIVFGPERGVAEANFGNPAGFADAHGRLWFGTIDGAVLIDAAAFPFNKRPPSIGFDAIWAGDRSLPLGTQVSVPPLTTRIRLSVTASDLLYPELMRFRFRVEGPNAEWIDEGTARSVAWTPARPGRHRVLVEARNEDGVWSDAPAVVELDVLPAWWQTTAARAAAALGVLIAGAVAFRLRVRQIERRHAGELRQIDEQRRADERMASLRAQLEHVSRVALVGELAASLAHEVKQPIGAMVNNAEAGRRHLAKYLQRPQAIEAIFGDIVADGMRASEIVRGLRNFLRPHETASGPVDLSGLIREMLPLVRRELQDNHVELALALGEALPPVEGSRVQLGQIVVNLVMNACEALAEVHGPRRLAIATRVRASHVELEVEDNGPGPDADVAPRMFEPFVTTKPDGLGMGLAICRTIAEAHGGHLTADAPDTGGFRVTLSLPAAKVAGPVP